MWKILWTWINKKTQFFKHENLKLTKKKYHRIHIGKGHLESPKVKVHEDKMQESTREKYLGDVRDRSANIQTTIDIITIQGNGIVAEIT